MNYSTCWNCGSRLIGIAINGDDSAGEMNLAEGVAIALKGRDYATFTCARCDAVTALPLVSPVITKLVRQQVAAIAARRREI
jgi:hypothetical protein